MFLFSVLIVSFFVLNGDVYLHWEKIIDKNIKGEEVVEGNGFVVNTKGVLIEYRGFDKYVTIPREIKGITITSDEDFSCFVIDICYNRQSSKGEIQMMGWGQVSDWDFQSSTRAWVCIPRAHVECSVSLPVNLES